MNIRTDLMNEKGERMHKLDHFKEENRNDDGQLTRKSRKKRGNDKKKKNEEKEHFIYLSE